jgi:nucleotide-binding universal stress UspA family protein
MTIQLKKVLNFIPQPEEMEKDSKTIIVPWDFSEVAEYALEHAERIARTLNKRIELLHIVKKSTDLEEAKESMVRVTTEALVKYGIKPEFTILEGSIFSRISNYASDTKANMVIMGTHGISGIQKMTGSYALRVLLGSKVPFIVVQDRPRTEEKFSNIVFPIDFKGENKEKLFWAIYLGKYFNSKVHLFKYPVTDPLLLKKVTINLNFALRFLIQHGLEYEIHTASKGDFEKETLNLAQKINADLILIVTTKNLSIFDFLFGTREQYIIANSAKIPVMVVNPRASFVSMGQFMFGATSY